MSEHDGVLRHTLSDGHPVHRHLRDAVEVDERCCDHEHVEYLVTLELNGHIFSGTDTSRTVLRGGDHQEFGGMEWERGARERF